MSMRSGPPAGAPNAITDLPPFCRVAGVIKPTSDSHILFEVWLPLNGWSGRFVGVGNGGWAGIISYGSLAEQLRRGNAAGSTDTGRPYFAMELVRGVPITRYCDENRLATAPRLELFIQICHAVQHAHQKGIIHRDLKPSNILVTLQDGAPVPKVIDFGIAKATAGRLTDQTLFTAFEQFIGTPAYMSPEQAVLTSLDIDTRSDIYSLGVLLYELLTGRTPFDAKELLAAGLDEMRRTIREQEPPRPSTRLSTLSAGVRIVLRGQATLG